jgi:hypothetical protein
MGSVTNSLSGLSYLTQPGGPLSNLPEAVSSSDLQSASPQDLASMSLAALQSQMVEEAFGTPESSPTTADQFPGIAANDLANATPQQQTTINNQSLELQEVQGLFAEPASTASSVNLFA